MHPGAPEGVSLQPLDLYKSRYNKGLLARPCQQQSYVDERHLRHEKQSTKVDFGPQPVSCARISWAFIYFCM